MTESARVHEGNDRTTKRITGLVLLLTAVSLVVTVSLSDPAIEEHHVRSVFIQQVESVADRAPAIYVFQVLEVARGFLLAALGVGLFSLHRAGAPHVSLAGLVMLAMSGVFVAGTAFIGAAETTAAQLYIGGHLQGTGAGSSDLLGTIQMLSVLHFASFLAAFAGLGLGIAAFSRAQLAAKAAPRWLTGSGVAAGVLLCLGPLSFIREVLFIPFFIGGLIALVWLVAQGLGLVRVP